MYLQLAVDWEVLAGSHFYTMSARYTRSVGECIAEMIDYVVKKNGVDINKFHLIGHSLGAHTVGFAGKFVKSGFIQRITGSCYNQQKKKKKTKDEKIFCCFRFRSS